MSPDEPDDKIKPKRGFAAMAPARVRELAKRGGVAAHLRASGWVPGYR